MADDTRRLDISQNDQLTDAVVQSLLEPAMASQLTFLSINGLHQISAKVLAAIGKAFSSLEVGCDGTAALLKWHVI